METETIPPSQEAEKHRQLTRNFKCRVDAAVTMGRAIDALIEENLNPKGLGMIDVPGYKKIDITVNNPSTLL